MAAIAASDREQADAALVRRFRQAQAEREGTAVFTDVVCQSDDEMQDSLARRASLQHWLEQIAATLPEARQRLFDLFVTRGLDSRNAAWELGTNVAEVRRLRRENRQAILRAFEVTALAAAEAGLDPPGSDAPGCGELRQVLAEARHDIGDPQAGGRRHTMVLPAALRLTVTRHLSQCGTCQGRRDDGMARWAPQLLPILDDTELDEQVTEDLHLVPELARPRDTPGPHGRVAAVGTSATAVVRRPAVAAAAGLLVALLLLAFVWPGFLHGSPALVPRGSTAPSSHDSSSSPSSGGTPQVTETIDGVPGHSNVRRVRAGLAGLSSSLPPEAAGSSAGPSLFASPTPPVLSGVQPSTTSPAAQQHRRDHRADRR